MPGGDDRDPSAARDEGHDNVGRVSVEVLAPTVVDGGGSRIGMPRCDLHVAKRHPGIERGHDERRSEHVGVYRSKPGALADRAHPPMGGATLETLPIPASKDRSFVAFADGEVDGAGGPRNDGDDGRLVALAEYPQRSMSSLEAEILDVGRARLGDAKPVQTEQHRQGRVVPVDALRGE